jgi:hypothetical protein
MFMQRRVGVSIFLLAMLLPVVRVDAVQTIPACRTIKNGKTLTLTADLDCSAFTANGAVGILMGTNSTLDCGGFTITGPVTSWDGQRNEYFGVYAEKKSKPKVKNCPCGTMIVDYTSST